ISDSSGNNVTETSTITVLDTLRPTIIGQDLTVYLDATGNTSITENDLIVTDNDNCTTTTVSLNTYNFTCTDLGPNTVIITSEDGSGNIAYDTVTVTVEDNISPSLTLQTATVYLDANGEASITAVDVVSAIADNCTIVSTMLSQSNFTCTDLGQVTITVTVEDQSGNQFSDQTTVDVLDQINPVLTLKDTTLYLDATGNTATLTHYDLVLSA